MPKGKEQDVEVIGDEIEEKPDAPSDVVVDLNKKEELKKEEPKSEPSRPQIDLSKLHNTIAFQTRKLDQAMREIQDLKNSFKSSNLPKAEKEEVLDEIDRIAQQDWKAGVKKLVEKDIETRVDATLKKRDDEAKANQTIVSREEDLAKSKQRVVSRYPEIEQIGSEENRLYIEVINEDTSLLSNTHGPEIAMYRMEEKMRQMGRVPASVKPAVDKEVNRLVRAGASSVVGRRASPDGKITLTREQKEFCDHYKIPYEQYARNLKADEARGGVEA